MSSVKYSNMLCHRFPGNLASLPMNSWTNPINTTSRWQWSFWPTNWKTGATPPVWSWRWLPNTETSSPTPAARCCWQTCGWAVWGWERAMGWGWVVFWHYHSGGYSHGMKWRLDEISQIPVWLHILYYTFCLTDAVCLRVWLTHAMHILEF